MRQSANIAAIDRRNCPPSCGGGGVGGAGSRSIALTRLVACSTTLLGPAAVVTRCLVLLRPMSLHPFVRPLAFPRRGRRQSPARPSGHPSACAHVVRCTRLLPAAAHYNDLPSNASTSPTHVRHKLVLSIFIFDRLHSRDSRGTSAAPPCLCLLFELTIVETEHGHHITCLVIRYEHGELLQ